MKKALGGLYLALAIVAAVCFLVPVLMFLQVPPFYAFYSYCVQHAYWLLVVFALAQLGVCGAAVVLGLARLQKNAKPAVYMLAKEKGGIGISARSIASAARLAACENAEVKQAEAEVQSAAAYTSINLRCRIQIQDPARWAEVALDVKQQVQNQLASLLLLECDRVEVVVDELQPPKTSQGRNLA